LKTTNKQIVGQVNISRTNFKLSGLTDLHFQTPQLEQSISSSFMIATLQTARIN
jgi:hypothetical protein